jgi:uncharacterized protein
MTDSLKIIVANIPEEGINFNLSEDGSFFKEFFTDSANPDFTLRKVDVDCLITKIVDTVFIKGNVFAAINACCSRCLEEVSIAAGGDFAYSLVPAKPENREDVELTAEELGISYYPGDFIDLTPIIYEQIILQIPIKILCREECRGLCPQCGINKNDSSCSCSSKVVDDRMAALKNFRVKN